MSPIESQIEDRVGPEVGTVRLRIGPRPEPATEAEVETALVRRCQQGDRRAFEELVRRTARLLYARLYPEARDRHKAEDLVQETYLIAWRSIGQVTEPGGFRHWLLSIAHTVAVDAARREGRKKRSGPQAPGDPADMLTGVTDPTGTEPGESLERREMRDRALELLQSLPEEYRQPLAMRYLADADYDTIARQLHLTNGSLRGLLHRGMAKLREMMGSGSQ